MRKRKLNQTDLLLRHFFALCFLLDREYVDLCPAVHLENVLLLALVATGQEEVEEKV